MSTTDSVPFPALALPDGEWLVYDRENPSAWIQTAHAEPLSEWR